MAGKNDNFDALMAMMALKHIMRKKSFSHVVRRNDCTIYRRTRSVRYAAEN